MEIKVTKNKILLDDKSKLNENEYNINNIDFTFSEEYTQELVKIALFSANNTNYKEIITQNQCKIPSEILANKGVFVLGVYAYSTEDVYKLTEDTEIDEDKTYYTRTGSGTEEEPYEYTEVENPIAENLSTYYEKNVKLSLRYSPSPIKLVVDSGSYIPDEQTQNSEPITASELEQYQQALNDGLREAENVNISAEKVDKVATITIIDRYGDETSVEIQDGTDGIDGKDAKINGVNTLTIKAGQNIEIEQEENTLIINGQSNYNNLTNKPKINNVELTGNKTTSDLGIVIPDVSGFITKDVNNLTNYTLKTATGSLIDLEINQSTYVVTLTLKDIDGNVISTDTIDLPLESVVVGGSYDATNKKIVLTLENGNTVDIPVGDLIAGLQTEITSKNKLASDLVDDTNSGNKFVTTSEKQAWNAKYDKPNGGIPKTDLDSSVQTSLGKADTALQEHQDLTDYVKNTDYASSSKGGVIKVNSPQGTATYSSGVMYALTRDYNTYINDSNGLFVSKGTLENVIVGKNLETANNKVTEIDENSTDDEYPSAKLLYDELAEKQEQIDGLVTENALLKDQIPNGTAEGTNVQITDSSNLPIEDGVIKGDTSQESTTGKNLANIHVITNLSNQFLSRQIVGDTIVLSNNTNSSGFLTTEKKLSEICPNLQVNDEVKLSFNTTTTTSQPTNAIYLAGVNQLWYINGVKTITQEMLDSMVILYGGYNETAIISNFMIRLASITDTSYEPYTNGASPNPNYKQDIHTVTGDCEVEVVNKNLFDIGEVSDYSPTGRVTSTANNILTFSVIGQGGTYSYNTKKNFAGNTTYIITAKTSVAYSRCFVRLRNSDDTAWLTGNDATITGWSYNQYYGGWYKDNPSVNVNFSVTIPECLYCQFGFGYGNNVAQGGETQTISEIQIEQGSGSTATTYTPHAHQTFSISLGTIELCKIGDYQDYLFKNTRTLRSGRANPLFNADLDEGDWYKYSGIDEVILNGTENWMKNENQGFIIPSANTPFSNRKISVADGYCNQFIFNKTFSTWVTDLTVGFNNTNVFWIRYDDKLNLSVEQWKTWLSTHNTEVYYALETPTYTKITDTTLIAQLEAYYNSSTYRNVTNIITTGDDLAPIASIVYKKDLTTLFNKLDSLEARVDLLE